MPETARAGEDRDHLGEIEEDEVDLGITTVMAGIEEEDQGIETREVDLDLGIVVMTLDPMNGIITKIDVIRIESEAIEMETDIEKLPTEMVETETVAMSEGAREVTAEVEVETTHQGIGRELHLRHARAAEEEISTPDLLAHLVRRRPTRGKGLQPIDHQKMRNKEDTDREAELLLQDLKEDKDDQVETHAMERRLVAKGNMQDHIQRRMRSIEEENRQRNIVE